MGPPAARLAAFRLLRRVDGGETAAGAAGELAELRGRDRAFALELAHGCLRLRGRLDAELDHLVDRPLGEVDPGVLTWLRLGLYQLRELRVPDHAAVNESVEGARRTEGRGAAGFVNAVLRRASREEVREELFPALEEDAAGHLAGRGSHPPWLVRRWLERWSVEEVARLVELDNRAPEVTGRWLGDGEPPASAILEAAGVEVEGLPPWPRAFRLVRGEPAALLRAARAVIQDPAASAVVDFLGPSPEPPVVDACAAPGGKTLGVADALARAASEDPPPVVAADVSPERLRRLRPAADRTGLRVAPMVMDARRPAVGRARTLLLDVPCTGTGTLRRRPDLRWRLGPDRLASLVVLQEEMLEAAGRIVEPGGLLVYATCSLEPEENEERVDAFLTAHPDFRREPPPATGLPGDVVDGRGDLQVLPWRYGTDGAYAARLRREGCHEAS